VNHRDRTPHICYLNVEAACAQTLPSFIGCFLFTCRFIIDRFVSFAYRVDWWLPDVATDTATPASFASTMRKLPAWTCGT
jgi:hypothetical protein